MVVFYVVYFVDRHTFFTLHWFSCVYVPVEYSSGLGLVFSLRRELIFTLCFRVITQYVYIEGVWDRVLIKITVLVLNTDFS